MIGGYCVIFRLTVEDYHRYCYIDNAIKGKNYRIHGKFYTVHPAVLGKEDIYKENTREYCILKTKNFGKVIQMEVGALLVGKIRNYHREAIVQKGQEKGRFEYGGSTVVLFIYITISMVIFYCQPKNYTISSYVFLSKFFISQ